MTIGLKVPAQTFVERQDPWVSEQCGAFSPEGTQSVEDVIHQLTAETGALVQGVNSNIPDGRFEHPVACAARKAHQTWDPGIVAPETNPDQAVVESLANPSYRSPAPAHRFQKLLQLHQIKGSVLAEHQSELAGRGRTQLRLIAIHHLQCLWRKGRVVDH